MSHRIDVPESGSLREFEVPPAVRWIAETLEGAGFETWAVGGAVRDAILGDPSMDWDLATRATPVEMRRLFTRTVPIGLEHGTVGVLARDGTLYEVTTFRRDVETSGRHAVVEFARRVEEDLSRRDFTINAVAWHPLRKEVLDPFGGARDLADGVLRTVGNPVQRFREDYLRILRALRFAGQFRLKIEPGCWKALVGGRERLHRLSPERVREELLKVLELPDRPSTALGLYAASGVLAVLLPEVAMTMDAPHRNGEPEEDAWTHALFVVDALSARRPLLRLAALLNGLGCVPLPEAETAPRGMDEAREKGWRAVRLATPLMERLRFSNLENRSITELVRFASLVPTPEWSGQQLRAWLSEVGPDRVPDLFRLWIASNRADQIRRRADPRRLVESIRSVRREVHARPPLTLQDLAFTGHDLIGMGLAPGPAFGAILRHLLEMVLVDPSLNRPDKLRLATREYLAGSRVGGEPRTGP